jgi:alkanesulfonate monooxygenase SsuD/methylene tetrahydromethanopterin reductase-like flavin-dependent oxidoreductase (luciferase family)
VAYGEAVADLGQQLRFGYFLVPNAVDPLLDTAREVERRGLEYVAIQDHPYQRRFVDTWVLMSMILATTSRIHVFPDVANLPLRPPAVMAKAAASLDVLSGGRFELGLGAGGFWDAIEAWGGPRRTPGSALQALREAIAVTRAIWSGERNLRFEGKHYRLAGAISGPVPAHTIGIWLGVYGPRALRLTAREADGWIPSFRGDVRQITEMTQRLDDEAAAGRDPREIRRILNLGGEIIDGRSDGPFRGPASQWIDEITDLAIGQGFDTFILWAQAPNQLARFAEEIVPAVRERVHTERG